MNDTRPLATLPGIEGEWTTGQVAIADRSYTLTETHLTRTPPSADHRPIVWSGGLGQSPFDPDPRTWLETGWGALRQSLDDAPPVMIRPHWAHVISDGPSLMRIVDGIDGVSSEVVMAPASMLAPGMLDDAHDHIERFMQHAGDRCGLVLLEDLDATGRPVDVAHGVLPGDLLGRLLTRCVPPEIPIIARSTNSGQVLQWLS